MYAEKQVLAQRPNPSRRAIKAPPEGVDPTPWGFRRRIATTHSHEVELEFLASGAHQGEQTAERGQLTVVVLAGVLWVRERSLRSIKCLQAGQSFTSTPMCAFEIATGSEGATTIVIRPPGFASALERVPGSGNQLEPEAIARSLANQARAGWRRQGTFEERTGRANAAQGVSRVQPIPVAPRSAADVALGVGQQGVNLAPVVPEP